MADYKQAYFNDFIVKNNFILITPNFKFVTKNVQIILMPIKRFPIGCRKTKIKVITLANRNRCKQHIEPIGIRSKRM